MADAEAAKIVDQSGNVITSLSSHQDTAHIGASKTSRELRNWNPPIESADSELLYELDTLVARSRDLVRNHGVASGAIQTLVDNVVGTGFRMQAKPDLVALGWTKEQGREWSKKVESKWRSWAESTECDAARQMNFASKTAMAFRTAMVSGEACAIPLWLSNRPGAKWSTAIMDIDPDRLGSPYDLITPDVRQGIKINKYGEPLGYYVTKQHPYDYQFVGIESFEYEFIPARNRRGRLNFIHMHDKERTGQNRGKPILSSVLPNFKMLDHYQRNELQAAVVNSLVAAFVESPMSGEQLVDLFGGSAKDYMADRAKWETELERGAVLPLYPGDKLSSFNPGRPSSVYKEFIETCVREVGLPAGMSYELVMKDFSKTNYSSARAALLECWRFFSGRRHFITNYWCQPIYELWFEEAVMRGEIEAPNFYENKAAYCRAKWIGNGRGWIDPSKEADAAQKRMNAGISSLEQECAEQGQDWEEVLEQRATEKQKMEELGIKHSDLNPTLQGQGAQPEEAGDTDEEPIPNRG